MTPAIVKKMSEMLFRRDQIKNERPSLLPAQHSLGTMPTSSQLGSSGAVPRGRQCTVHEPRILKSFCLRDPQKKKKERKKRSDRSDLIFYHNTDNEAESKDNINKRSHRHRSSVQDFVLVNFVDHTTLLRSSREVWARSFCNVPSISANLSAARACGSSDQRLYCRSSAKMQSMSPASAKKFGHGTGTDWFLGPTGVKNREMRISGVKSLAWESSIEAEFELTI
jgi:hypothetical protein